MPLQKMRIDNGASCHVFDWTKTSQGLHDSMCGSFWRKESVQVMSHPTSIVTHNDAEFWGTDRRYHFIFVNI